MKQKNIALILILNVFAFVGTVVLVANPLPSESNPHLLKTTESKADKSVLEFVKRLVLANQGFSSNQSLNSQSLVLPVQTNRYSPPKNLAFHVQTNKYKPQEILVLNTQAETEDLLGTDFMVADYVCEFAAKNEVRLDNIVFSPSKDNCSRQVIDFANETSCEREYEVYQNFFIMKKPKKRYLECVNAVKDKLVANVDSLIEERRKKEAEAVARIEGEEFWGTDFVVQDYICGYLAKNKVHSGNVVFSPNEDNCTLQVVHFLNKTSCESEYNTCRDLLRMGKSIPTKYVDCVHAYRNILVSKVDSWIEEIARQEKLKKEAEARAERERLEEIARQEKLKKEAEKKAERERLAEIAKQEQLKKEAEEKRLEAEERKRKASLYNVSPKLVGTWYSYDESGEGKLEFWTIVPDKLVRINIGYNAVVEGLSDPYKDGIGIKMMGSLMNLNELGDMLGDNFEWTYNWISDKDKYYYDSTIYEEKYESFIYDGNNVVEEHDPFPSFYFHSYVVTDTNLLLNYENNNNAVYLTKYTPRPPSALIGNWTIRDAEGNIAVSITQSHISLKRGRKISTKAYTISKKFPLLCYESEHYDSCDAEYASHMLGYVFIDDTHVLAFFENFERFEFKKKQHLVILQKN